MTAVMMTKVILLPRPRIWCNQEADPLNLNQLSQAQTYTHKVVEGIKKPAISSFHII